MEVNMYKDYEEWINENPSYVVEGEIEYHRGGLILLKTAEKNHRYKEIIASSKIFAITYQLPSGFLMYHDEIHFYKEAKAWESANPTLSLEGQICLDECTNEHITFISKDGYKQIIFLAHLFSISYERK